MPIGGLRDKTMAAYRMGIKKVIIPKKNMADLAEVDPKVKGAIRFIPATNLDEVFENALITEKEDKKTVAAMATGKDVGYNIMRT